MSKNAGLVALFKFTRALLGYEGTQTVLIGRGNMNRGNFTQLQIVLDNLDSNNLVAFASKYDGVNEVMTYTHKVSAPVSIDFYGDSAYSECERFVLLLGSERGYELSRDLGVEVYLESAITDLKLLTGELYSQRLQIRLRIQYNISLSETILRIDELDLSVEHD